MSEELIYENLLIASLPPGLREEVEADLRPSYLQQQTSLSAPGLVREVVFPVTCVLSLMTQTGDGQSVENVAIGYEGATVFQPGANMRLTAQLAGDALRMPYGTFNRYMNNPEFREVIEGYRDRILSSACQTAVCQAFHTAEQRLAHWLLVMHDRARSSELPLTQDFLATMLGVQRPTVTIAARILQAADLIHYRYGRVTILDPEGLTEAACECYMQNALSLARADESNS